MTFVELNMFFLIRKLQVQAQTFYAAGCSLGWQRAGAHGRADATRRRRPICNFPLYGARHATVCSKPASAEASAASKTLGTRAPSVGERRRREERQRLRALWRQRRRWTENFRRDSIVSMIVWEIKYLFEVLLFCVLVHLEVRPNQTNTHTTQRKLPLLAKMCQIYMF